MKNRYLILIVVLVVVLFQSCKKDSSSVDSSELGGDPSPMGVVGTTLSSSSLPVSGISGFSGKVDALSGGISSYSGKAVVQNSVIKNILSNYPAYKISGDTISVSNFQFKQTLEGIQSYVKDGEGILVKYGSAVGDKYTVGSTGRTRTVISKSTADDYYYGGLMIKVMQIEEPTPGFKSVGISKITYWANHKFGLVGVTYNLTDGSTISLPVYCTTANSK